MSLQEPSPFVHIHSANGVLHVPKAWPANGEIVQCGAGTFGQVYKIKTESGLVAIKRFKEEAGADDIDFIREWGCLSHLTHPNIIQMFCAYECGRTRYLVLEPMNCDLHYVISTTRLEHAQQLSIMYQILCGISACHQAKIMHRDIKPANILLHHDGVHVKLGDFGSARGYMNKHKVVPTNKRSWAEVVAPSKEPIEPKADEGSNKPKAVARWTTYITTLYYRAPEVLTGCDIYSNTNGKTDMWSVGCTFAELLMQKPLFRGECEQDQVVKILDKVPLTQEFVTYVRDHTQFKSKVLPFFEQRLEQDKAEGGNTHKTLMNLLHAYVPDEAYASSCVSLIESLLHLTPRKRRSSRKALQHPCFDIVRAKFSSVEAQKLFDNSFETDPVLRKKLVKEALATECASQWPLVM